MSFRVGGGKAKGRKEGGKKGDEQSFLEPSPIATSSTESKIKRSSMRLICSWSYRVLSSVILYDGVDMAGGSFRSSCVCER